MRRAHDVSEYEELEAAIAAALVREIRAVLEDAGLRGRTLKSAVAATASSAADIFDGAAYAEANEVRIVPILGFATGRMRNRLLIPEEGGSSVHEFIPGAVRSAFRER